MYGRELISPSPDKSRIRGLACRLVTTLLEAATKFEGTITSASYIQ